MLRECSRQQAAQIPQARRKVTQIRLKLPKAEVAAHLGQEQSRSRQMQIRPLDVVFLSFRAKSTNLSLLCFPLQTIRNVSTTLVMTRMSKVISPVHVRKYVVA